MRIAIDYDKTWTADPVAFSAIASLLSERGHAVCIVTMRHESEPVPETGLPVFYTSRKAKRPFMDACGVPVDVWIDDSPHWINTDSF